MFTLKVKMRLFLAGLAAGAAAHLSGRILVITGNQLVHFAGHVAAAIALELTDRLK